MQIPLYDIILASLLGWSISLNIWLWRITCKYGKVEKKPEGWLDRGGVIYKIRCPDDGHREVYIGRATNFERRKREHLSRAKQIINNNLYTWIAGLLEEGKEPVFEVIDTASTLSQLKLLERRHIASYREQGYTLLNKTNGG